MAHHHHIADYKSRASKKLHLYLHQNYPMVNFITGRSHSLLEKFILQQSGWLETEEKERHKIWGCHHLQVPLMQIPLRLKYLRKGKYWFVIVQPKAG